MHGFNGLELPSLIYHIRAIMLQRTTKENRVFTAVHQQLL